MAKKASSTPKPTAAPAEPAPTQAVSPASDGKKPSKPDSIIAKAKRLIARRPAAKRTKTAPPEAAVTASPPRPAEETKAPERTKKRPARSSAVAAETPAAPKTEESKKPAARSAPKRAASLRPIATEITSAGRVPTHDEIALRAYFIHERRRVEGREGDSHSDWVEAERQLMEELRQEASA